MQFTKSNNAILLSCLVLFLTPFLSSAQTQIGEDIYGQNNGDFLGTNVSMPDRYTVAVGTPYNDSNGTNAGQIRIFHRKGSKWFQKGNDILGDTTNDYAGQVVSMPDSNTIAFGLVGVKGSNNNSGHTRIYRWNNNVWVQKGSDIIGEAPNDGSGTRISMPDSNTIAIGAPWNDGNGTDAGHVRIYKWIGNAWDQIGDDIEGKVAGNEFGSSVNMPDSITVAISAPKGTSTGLPPVISPNYVQVFRWNGTNWVQMGSDLGGDTTNLYGHSSLSMPNATTIALGSPRNNSNGVYSGQVRIYRWNVATSSWFQKGNFINGESSHNLSGFSVSMPDSNTVAIGAPYNTGKGNKYYSGHTRIYKWNDSSHIWVQKGRDIDGKIGSQSGTAVCMPDSNTLAVGAPLNNDKGTEAGHVRFYSFCITKDTINVSACNEYVSPSGEYTWSKSGRYEDVLVNAAGCDSIITVNLNIESTYDTLTLTECTFYQSPSGKYNWDTSGQYQDTLVNAAGCDSIITINLSLESTYDTIVTTECSAYLSPSGNYSWNTSGQYQDTLVNAVGCDSILTIHLTVEPIYDTLAATACKDYLSPSGRYIWNKSGEYQDTLNSAGCDSIITVNLSIESTYDTIAATACSAYRSPSGKYTWATSGQYQDTLVNAAACDSVITVNLIIDTINTEVIVSGDSLISADATANTYQWLDCKNNWNEIPGETNRYFIPTNNSESYAVSLEKWGCMDTSECVSITSLFDRKNSEELIKIYPNPSKGLFTIDYPFTHESKVYTVTDVKGKIVKEGIINQKQVEIKLADLPIGVYMLRIEDEVVKLVKE